MNCATPQRGTQKLGLRAVDAKSANEISGCINTTTH